MLNPEKPGHLRLLGDKDDPVLRGGSRWADRGDVSVRGGRQSLDEALPKSPEILIKVPKLRMIVVGEKFKRGTIF
jgi:hypothetical protein